MSKPKKGFADQLRAGVTQPAAQFISQAQPVQAEDAQPFEPVLPPDRIVPVSPRAQPSKVVPGQETKSERMQLLVKPSVLAWLKVAARADGVSVNAFIGGLFEREMKARGGK